MNTKITAASTNARYLSSDTDMLLAEEAYQNFEETLLDKINRVRTDYPGYHDYIYNIADIDHDPYVLISILSAVKPGFKLSDPEIKNMFHIMEQPRHQYTLTITKVVAPNYQADYGDKSIDDVPPMYLDLQISLKNYDLFCTVDSILTHDQLAAYAGYMRSRGGRPDLFPQDKYPHATLPEPLMPFHVPATIRQAFPVLKRELEIAEPLVGYPYVWGGGDIETSFDCSGFIDYVMDQMGYHFRNSINGKQWRLPVAGSRINGQFYDGIYEKCIPIDCSEAQPGDLVFFTGSFEAGYRKHNLTHVGFYMGDDVFLGCNSSTGISFQPYSKIDKRGRTWQQKLVCYGKLPPLK